jgi:hypothetical protein
MLNRYTLSVFISFVLMITHALPANADESMISSQELIFVTVAYPSPHSEINTLILAESIRGFGGKMAQAPIWCMVPEYGKTLSSTFKDRTSALNVDLIPFEVDAEIIRFFFATDIRAAALAESLAAGKTRLLAWLSSNTIVLHEPSDFLLPPGKKLGYRPVHHTNVGSLYDSPPDEFWKLVYQHCGVSEEQVFPMKTHVDGNIIRPYFNAGMLVTRPELGLFKRWRETFLDTYRKPALQELYKKDTRYHIFLHQAILSGVILTSFSKDEIVQLPPSYNYPMHLYAEDMTESRPKRIDDLVTIRHEGFYTDKDWMDKIPVGDSLKQWLADRIK